MSYPLKRRAMALRGLTPIEVARVVKKLALRCKRQTNPSERRRTWVLSKIQWGG